MYLSILVPFDGSSHAQEALRVASELAPDRHATVTLLNVPEFATARDELGRWTGAIPLDSDRAQFEQAAYNQLKQAWEALDWAKAEVAYLVRWGRPAAIILAEAARLDVEAIVMGSRGLSDLRGLVVGSVSHKVTHAAKCHVITVH